MNAKEILARSNAIYDKARAEGATPHDRVLWGDPERQYRRFGELIELAGPFDATDIEVLDVGCGNGELFDCLRARDFCGVYRGIDIHAGQIEEARNRFPGVDFHVGDLFADRIAPADVVLMSGVLNVDCGQDTAFVERFIGACAALARSRFAFNAITTYVSRRDTGLFYLAPEDALGMAAKLSGKFELRHGFLPFNYTLCIHTGMSEPAVKKGQP